MNELASQVNHHASSLPPIVIITILVFMAGMVGWTLFVLGKFLLKLFGFSKQKS